MGRDIWRKLKVKISEDEINVKIFKGQFTKPCVESLVKYNNNL